ncbi:MAG: hypothetical protein ACI9A2_002487 [Halioglobus sp.]|jgi:hypothetical protein
MYMTMIVAVIVGGIYLLFRPPERRIRAAPGRLVANPYPAAAIGPKGGGGCAEVLALKHQRFLAWEAPSIPVPQCSLEICQCRYVYFADRRMDHRRYDNLSTAIWDDSDRRETSDRRREILGKEEEKEKENVEVDMEFSNFAWRDELTVGASEPANLGVWRDPADKRPPPKSSTQQKEPSH